MSSAEHITQMQSNENPFHVFMKNIDINIHLLIQKKNLSFL